MACRRAIFAIGMLLVACANGGEAAESPKKPDVPRVRITTGDETTIVGSLVALTVDEIVVARNEREEVRFERAAVTKLEVSRRRSNRGKALGYGFLAGTAVGLGIGLATEEDCAQDNFCTFGGCATMCFNSANTAGLGLLGAVSGSLIGLAVSHGETWQNASPDALKLVIVPRKGGVGLRIAFSF